MSNLLQGMRGNDPRWNEVLASGHRSLCIVRAGFRHLPTDPRCKLCVAPFGGLGGKVSGLFGFKPSRMNPNFCANCLESLPPGGAEAPIAVSFAAVTLPGAAENRSVELNGLAAPVLVWVIRAAQEAEH